MVPSRSSRQHGPPLLGRVRRHPFPDVIAPIGSSDFLSSVGPRSGRPLQLGLPSESASSLRGPRGLGRAVGALSDRRHVGAWSPGLRLPGNFERRAEDLPGYWAVLLQRAALDPPRPSHRRLAHDATGAAAFTRCDALGSGNIEDIEAQSRGPLFRAPTLRRARCRTWRQARYRPAGLSFGRAGFAPAGRQTEFHEFIAFPQSFLTSIAWSHPQRLRPR